MRLRETIDRGKNPCCEKRKGELAAFIIETSEELKKERLLRALGLILSEADILEFIKLKHHASSSKELDSKPEKA
jgi:hypothetical protein